MTQYPESVYYEKEFYDEADVRNELRTRGLELEGALRSIKGCKYINDLLILAMQNAIKSTEDPIVIKFLNDALNAPISIEVFR